MFAANLLPLFVYCVSQSYYYTKIILNPTQLSTFCCRQQAVVADPYISPGHDVLTEPAKELNAGKEHLLLVVIAVVMVFEPHSIGYTFPAGHA